MFRDSTLSSWVLSNSWVEVSWCHQMSPFANSPGTPGLQTLFPVGSWVMSSLRLYPEDTDLPSRFMYQHILTCFSQTSVWNHFTWLYIRSLSLFKTSFILTYFVEGCRHTIAWVWKLEDNLKELVLSFHDGFLTSSSGRQTWHQVPLLMETSSWPEIIVFFLLCGYKLPLFSWATKMSRWKKLLC